VVIPEQVIPEACDDIIAVIQHGYVHGQCRA
jgi:hypothetical protein